MNNLNLTTEQATALIEKYGSPLYVYDERILRTRCQDMKGLLKNYNYKVSYSAKANSNLSLLKIIKDEGLHADAMSPGEILLEEEAGFSSDEIFYISNNVSSEEMQYAIDRNVLVSVDSISQLITYGQLNPGGNIAIRFNAGIGAGHHEKVITSGKKTKFGVAKEDIPVVKLHLQEYNLNLVGINQHIGSLFLDSTNYVESVKSFLEIANEFSFLDFIDFGGGYGVPYSDTEERLDINHMSTELAPILDNFLSHYDNKDVCFQIEPGRYIVCECGTLLGTVHSIKDNYGIKYIGTDIGFSALMRPVMYSSYHHINVFQQTPSNNQEIVTVVGNICESGDILAQDRLLPTANLGDVIAIENASAYGYSMSSNYNCRLRPAEVLITSTGEDKLIRRRDTLNDLMNSFI